MLFQNRRLREVSVASDKLRLEKEQGGVRGNERELLPLYASCIHALAKEEDLSMDED